MTELTKENVRAFWRRRRVLGALRELGYDAETLRAVDDTLAAVDADLDAAEPVSRYEVLFYIGPCSEDQATALCEAILELPEAKAVGAGGVGLERVREETGVEA